MNYIERQSKHAVLPFPLQGAFQRHTNRIRPDVEKHATGDALLPIKSQLR